MAKLTGAKAISKTVVSPITLRATGITHCLEVVIVVKKKKVTIIHCLEEAVLFGPMLIVKFVVNNVK